MDASGLLRATRGLGLDRFHRTARLLPGAEAALEVSDRRKAHVLRRLGRECRAPGAGAEEHELVAGLEVVLGVGRQLGVGGGGGGTVT